MKNYEIREEGGQFIGNFSAETAPTDFIKHLIAAAAETGTATIEDAEGCQVTASEI